MSDITDNKNTFNLPVCNNCKNHIDGLKCKAFKTIPNVILSGKNNHSKPLLDQKNDIVFEGIK